MITEKDKPVFMPGLSKQLTDAIKNPQSAIRNSKFSLDGNTIIFTPSKGFPITGKIIKNDNGYAVHLTGQHNLSDKKKSGLEKRMRDWYYYTHIQKK